MPDSAGSPWVDSRPECLIDTTERPDTDQTRLDDRPGADPDAPWPAPDVDQEAGDLLDEHHAYKAADRAPGFPDDWLAWQDGLELDRDDARRRAEIERTEKVVGLANAGEYSHAERLAKCCQQSAQLECGDCGSDDNFVEITCDSRLCPRCARRRMGQLMRQYRSAIEDWPRASLITLTIPNVLDVVTGVDRVIAACKKLRRRTIPTTGSSPYDDSKTWAWSAAEADGPVTNYWRTMLARGVGRDEMARLESKYVNQDRNIPVDDLIESGIYGVDIKQQHTENPGEKRYHVHIHVLCNAAYIPQPALSSVWHDITRHDSYDGSGGVVDIRRVDDSEAGLAEVVGYVSKPPEYESVKDEIEAALSLKGRRLVQPFGDLHGNTLEDHTALLCCTCERIPRQWEYLGVVDKQPTTVLTSESGDRPPP